MRASGRAVSERPRVCSDAGSVRVRADRSDALDTATRAFRRDDPCVTIIAGGADTIGTFATQGIPVERPQVSGRGNRELPVDTGGDVPEPGNRVVEISWR